MLNKKVVFIFATLFLILISAINSHAAADFALAGVLPKGRYQGAVRMGQVAEIQDKYNSSGTLQTPSRMNIKMDNQFLMSQPLFKALAQIVDSQFPNQKPSKDLDAGAVQFKGEANVNYVVPQLARGLTSKWTLGVVVPFVNYESDIEAYNTGTNTIGAVVGNSASIEKVHEAGLGNAVDRAANGGAKALLEMSLEQNGYKPVTNRDAQFVADVVVGSSYKILEQKIWSLYMLNYLTLPTGPKDDPDDLLDLNIFGKTTFQTVLYNNFLVTEKLSFGLGAFYTWGIEDDIEKRVPRAAGDSQPPPSTKENLRKNPGDAVGLQLHSFYKFTDTFDVGVGYESNFKQADNYSGARGQRYDLLEQNTNSTAHYAKFKMSYSTVDTFIKGESKIPYSITYAYSDLIRGKNTERELNNEILLKFYF